MRTCNCVGGPPEFGKCNACGAVGPGYKNPYEIPAKPGWVCPRCGIVNAPWMPQCTCNSNKITC